MIFNLLDQKKVELIKPFLLSGGKSSKTTESNTN
jgi:hypothetical protein